MSSYKTDTRAKGDDYARKLISKFYESVEMPGGWAFNHPQTLKLIDLYYNSKYKTGQYDPQGFRKFFYNIVKPTCDIATKFIDLDTSNINLIPEMAGNELRIFLMQRRLKQWLKDNGFAKLLNDLTFYWPIYGHLVLKKNKEGWGVTPLQNLRMDTSAESLAKSPCVYEVLLMTPGELDSMKGWDTKELYDRGEEETYVIHDSYEREGDQWYHCVKGDLWSRKKKGGMVRNVEAEINNQGEEWVGSVTLFDEYIDELPYREIKWEHVPGRWLGRGFVEYLEDNQVARNETENLERKGLMYSSLKLFQTRDQNIGGRNILTRAQNGDIVKIESEITPIAMEERNLTQFTATRQNWDSNTERKTFTSDITTGASLPSRTPLGVANLQATLASSFFERKREELGIFLKDLLLNDIIPSFQKDTSVEHTLVFSSTDEDTEYLDKAITDTLVGEQAVNYAKTTGWFPSKEQKELIRLEVMDKLKGRKNRFLKIPDSYWKNAKYYVDIDITGESIDVNAKSQILQIAMQIVGTNPGVTENPVTRSILFKLLSLGGINPGELNLVSQGQPQQQPQVAGSIARPTATQGMSTSTQRI